MGETRYEAEKFTVERREVPLRSGGTRPRDVVVTRDAVVVIPILPDGRILLIENRRPLVEATLLEAPAGTIDPGEDPAACAARELEEETGWAAGRVEPLGAFHSSPGLITETIHAFLARDLTEGERALTETESIELRPTAPEALPDLVRDGKLRDAKTLAALHLLEHHAEEA